MLNPFNYTLAQLRKAVVAVVIAGASLAVYFVAVPAGFQQDAIVVVGELFAVIGVFAAKNSGIDDYEKALKALVGGAIALVGLFVPGGVNPDVLTTVVGVLSQLVLVYGVIKAGNSA